MKKVVFAGIPIIICLLFVYYRYNRIAYIDSNRILAEFIEAQKVTKEMKQKHDDFEANVKTLMDTFKYYSDSLQEMVQKYPKRKANRGFAKIVMKKGQDAERYKIEMEKRLNKEKAESLRPVFKKINTYLTEYGKKHNYDIIFGATGAGTIVYGGDKIDITNDVIEKLNEKYEALR